MKGVLIVFFLISLLAGGLNTISRVNRYTQEAAVAYAEQNYVQAIAAYEYLLNDLEVQDDQIRLNLAHSYYQAGMLEKAQKQYRLLSHHPSKHIQAVSLLQQGNIAAVSRKYKQALALFRTALVANPANQTARYNYELLKKYLELHPEAAVENEEESHAPPAAEENNNFMPPATEEAEHPKKKPDANGNQEEEVETGEQEESPDGKNSEQSNSGAQNGTDTKQNPLQGDLDKEQDTGAGEGDIKGLNPNNDFNRDSPQRSSSENISENDLRAQTQRTRLQRMNISPEKAQILLDAMRNAELQYIQQLPKKSTAKPDHTKPDW